MNSSVYSQINHNLITISLLSIPTHYVILLLLMLNKSISTIIIYENNVNKLNDYSILILNLY